MNLECSLDGRGDAVDLAAAVVGNYDGWYLVLDGELGILDTVDALDYYG